MVAFFVVAALCATVAASDDGSGKASTGGAASPLKRASGRERDPAEEEAYAAPLAARDPRLAETFHRATRASDSGKTAEAEAAYREILAVVPDHAPTLRRLSYIEGQSGRRDASVKDARAALATGPGWEGKAALASALLNDAFKHQEDLPEAGRLVSALRREHPGAVAWDLAARLAVAANDIEGLRKAVELMERDGFPVAGSAYYRFIVDMKEGNLDAADADLTNAVAGGFPAATAQRIREDAGIASRARIWTAAHLGGWLLGAWLFGLGVIFLGGWAMSRRTLGAIERFDGKDLGAFRATTRKLRFVYEQLIRAAAAYYYISIPIVVAVVLLLAGGIFYGFIMLGRIPVKLLGIVAILTLASVWAMLRSVFVRRGPDEDPGRPVTEAEAPGLWALQREVAGVVGTRVVDAIYVTLGTQVAVVETGKMTARLRDGGKRSLILGLGVLDGMTRQQLRGVLAHEYGHFSNRDTAGGGLALVVQASLFNSMVRIAQSGGAMVVNPAWHFVRGFHAMFLRITLGASRLREVMADQLAATAYGARAFTGGLEHVVARSLEFDRNVAALATRAERDARPIASLYALPEGLAARDADQELKTAVAAAMNDAGSAYDSHPPPGKRIAWVSRLASEPAAAADADAPAWGMFANREALEREMTALANDRLRAQGLFEG